MSSGYVVPVDPHSFARFATTVESFSEDDEPLYPEDIDAAQEDVESVDNAILREQVEALISRLPDRESDILHLYFFRGKRQADIATIFGVTQAAISYRIKRGIVRVQFLVDLPVVSREDMIRDLSLIWPSTLPTPDVLEEDPEADLHMDVRILVAMWESTCQSEVASTLKLTQGRVRHRFFNAVATLHAAAETNPILEPYAKIFDKLSSKKFNILREVQLPQWAGRGGDEIL